VPELHLDQNVPGMVAFYLRQLHYDLVTAREIGMERAEDAEHLLHAAQNNRVIITKDKDYLVLQVAWLKWPPAWNVPSPPPHAGILIIHDHWSASSAAQEVHRVLSRGGTLTNVLYHYDAHHRGGPAWVPH